VNSLVIFKSTLVNVLRSSVDANLSKYERNDAWVAEQSAESAREMATGVEVAGQLSLVTPDDGDLKDTVNAIELHKALRHLTPLQARDPRLWTRMTHVDFWQYMRKRWPVEKYLPNRDKAVRFIESRYFVPQSQSRALLRNGIARLWWTAQLSHDPDRDSPYELTEVLFSTLDVTQQIVERGMGRASSVIRGFLEFLLRNSDTLLTGGDKNRWRIRSLAKHLNMHGGVCILDLLTQSEVMDILGKELARLKLSEPNTPAEAKQA
jgi:hypothetical protein